MIWTKELNWFNSSITDSSFISPAATFANNRSRGIDYVKQILVPNLGGGKTLVDDEIIHQVNSRLDRFKGSKILILGAGPTTTEVNWEADDYDFVFSTNHFFMNDRVKGINVSLANIGDEVRFSNKELHEYLEKHNTMLCFENCGRDPKEMKKFKAKYGDRVFWAHTRYHSKIGAIPRLVVIATLLGALEIHIAGMDGYIPTPLSGKHYHAFQKQKDQTGAIENSNKEEEIIEKYSKQFLVLWDYLLHDIGKDVKFRNLGHGHPCNISTQVLTGVLGEEYQRYLLDRSS
jgi:hypothetical protein